MSLFLHEGFSVLGNIYLGYGGDFRSTFIAFKKVPLDLKRGKSLGGDVFIQKDNINYGN